jgi:RNA-directed DNA polymerase
MAARAPNTPIVELTPRGEEIDFLGCHLRIVRSHFKGKTYLFRWPSTRAMNAVREKIRGVTHWRRWGRKLDLDEVTKELNPILRGWCNYFRTGNASRHFRSIDRYVTDRLQALLRRRRCHQGRQRNRRRSSGIATGRTPASSAITASTSCSAPSATPELRMQPEKVIGKPCAGERHARFERGPQMNRPNRQVI